VRTGPLLLVLLAACGDEPPALTVGPVSYTEDALLGLSDTRRDALVGLTALGIAVADSTTATLGAPQIDAWADDLLIDILAADLTLEKHGVEDDVLRARYALDPDWELTVRHLLVFSDRGLPEAQREAARARAARGLQMLQAGSGFADVEAELTSEGGPLVRAGTMPPAREGAFVPEFWEAASALQPGELSPVTETQYGFHVLSLIDRADVPFEEARSSVARRVARSIENPRAVYEGWVVDLGGDDASRRAAALEEARARGLTVPASDRLELVRRWETSVLSWSIALGFAYGLTPDQVGQAALAALATPAQTADIARRELASHAEMLRAAYPVVVGTP
jgi:hypothetical protein